MIKFKTTKGVAAKIEEVIRQAEKHVVLVSPYLQISGRYTARLRGADNRGVEINLLYRHNKLDAEHEARLSQLKNLRLFQLKNLHAKCYYNEKELIITSMNLYEHSERHNWEMGVLATKEEPLYREAVKEAESLFDEAERHHLTGTGNGSSKSVSEILGYQVEDRTRDVATAPGYCIRCGQEIDRNTEAPYCRACYKSWVRWENPDYEEVYCHTCGSRESTTFAKPQCYRCYQAQPA